MFEILLLALLFLLGFLWLLYQLFRNEAVFAIKHKWLWMRDERFDKYSYDSMFNPSRKNWFGLKYPVDKDFK